MVLHPVTPTPAEWDAFVSAHPRAHLLQTSAWGELKAAFGWRSLRVAVQDDAGRLCAGVQILLRRLPLRLGWLAYAPYGPLVDWSDAAQVKALLAAVDAAAKRHGAAFPKIEPGYGLDADLAAWGFRLSPQTVQPPRTYMLDISGTEEAILARMNQGTRRNIRKSAKYEVAIREGTRADVASFNALMRETGERDAFGVHAPEYYALAYDLFVPRGQAVLLLGSHGGRDLAGVMVFALGGSAWYSAWRPTACSGRASGGPKPRARARMTWSACRTPSRSSLRRSSRRAATGCGASTASSAAGAAR